MCAIPAPRFGPLETRAYFINSLPKRGFVKFPCDHEYLVQEVQEWLHVHSYCPACHNILFEETAVQNDILNIRRARDLIALSHTCATEQNYDMATKLHRKWRTLLEERANNFLEGRIMSSKDDYGIYRVRFRFPKRTGPTFPPDRHRVDANALTNQLESEWVDMFIKSGVAVSSSCQDAPVPPKQQITKLLTPCHPLAIKLLSDTIEVLRSLDGLVWTAGRLYEELETRFTASAVYAQWVWLMNKGEETHGFFIYQRFLVDIVVHQFTHLPVVQRRLRDTGREISTSERRDVSE